MVENGKPSPEIFLEAAKIACNAAQTNVLLLKILIGIEGASRAGMTTVFVPNSKTQCKKKNGIILLLHSSREIKSLNNF